MQYVGALNYLFLPLNIYRGAYNLGENARCYVHVSGQQGFCLEASQCGSYQIHGDNLGICSYRQGIPIVCCPNKQVSRKRNYNFQAKRISARKCEEYTTKLSPRSLSDADEEGIITFITGGTRAYFYEFPHIAAVGWRRPNGIIDWICGGSLISEKFVLSSAHCASFGRSRPHVVRIGEQDLLSTRKAKVPLEFSIKNIIIHPQYNINLKYHDLALIELIIPTGFNHDLSPACLRQENNDPQQMVEALGYGQTSFGGPQSNALLKGSLSIVDNRRCNQAYIEDSYVLPYGIASSQICAWDPAGSRDTCQGDSGGPLQITKYTRTSQKYYEIIGVTSFGKYCAAGIPGVYARVSSYLNWIERIVWK